MLNNSSPTLTAEDYHAVLRVENMSLQISNTNNKQSKYLLAKCPSEAQAGTSCPVVGEWCCFMSVIAMMPQ